jgi:hypothetical protein
LGHFVEQKEKHLYEMSLYNRETSSKGKKKEERERERPLKTQSKERTKSKSFYLLQVGKLKVDKEGK